MSLPRRALVFLVFAWVFVTLYPDPGVLVSSVRNLLAPRADARAARTLAAALPDDPREIERRVLADVVPYASDWEAAGVPWSFPSAAQALRAWRGDCESRALVLASVLAAKGVPYQLRMSFDHIWVEYPGKVPTAGENDARALTGTGDGGWSWLRWPDDLDLGREARAQAAIYWGPMPAARKALLFAGAGWIVLWNTFAGTLTRSPVGRARLSRAIALQGSVASSGAGDGPSRRRPPGARRRRRAWDPQHQERRDGQPRRRAARGSGDARGSPSSVAVSPRSETRPGSASMARVRGAAGQARRLGSGRAPAFDSPSSWSAVGWSRAGAGASLTGRGAAPDACPRFATDDPTERGP